MNTKRVAIVTGGAKGIGAQVCRTLAKECDAVVVADLDFENARKLVSEIGSNHLAKKIDISNEASVIELFDDIESSHGQVTDLVCTAGLLIMPGGSRPLIKEMTTEIWNKSYDVNTTGAFLCSRELLRRREISPTKRGGVVFFSSVAAQLGGYRSSAAYISAKSALLGYMKAFAREAAPLGITSNAIAPGLIDTDMFRQTTAKNNDLEMATKQIPLRRLGTPQDVANAVSFLLSDKASYITGSVIDVNGGYRMQ